MAYKKETIVKNLIIVTGTFLIIADFIEGILNFKFPTGSKHVLLILTAIFLSVFFTSSIKIFRTIIPYFVVLFIYLSCNVLFKEVNLFNYFLGFLFTFLFIFVFLFYSNLKIKEGTLIQIFIFFSLFFFIASVYSIIQALYQQTSLRWAKGIFREVGALAGSLNVATIIALFLFGFTKKKKYLFLAIFFTIVILATILKKSIVSNFFIWLAFFLIFKKETARRYLVYYFLGIIALLPFLWNAIADNFAINSEYLAATGAEEHVRIGMYIASVKIANDNFPFGSGLGTFVSLPSIYNGYSEIYYKYGVSDIGSNSPQDVELGAHTLLDTFWPHIIGELGYIGFALYLLLFLYPLRRSINFIRGSENDFLKLNVFYIVSLTVLLGFEGITLFTPEVPSFIFFFASIGGLCFSFLMSSKKLDRKK